MEVEDLVREETPPLDAIVAAVDPLTPPALHAALQEVLDTRVHALLLYGSRARGEETADSDWDLLAVVEDARPAGVRRRHRDLDLDVDARTLADMVDGPADEMIHFVPSRVLWDPDGVLDPVLRRIEARRAEGPDPLPDAELARWQAWIHRMLRRIASNLAADPVLADYQMSWLHQELLELYFRSRRRWTMGARHALRWLATNDPDTYAPLRSAAAPASPAARHDALRSFAGRCLPEP